MAFLAPLFFVGLLAIAVPVIVHLIQRERKDIVAFPSLMFIRRIPYESVERRRIHNWPLLLLRAAAMALVVAAFARPFFTVDPVRAAASLDGARDVVILLDRSASMGYGDHFARAQEQARQIVSGLGGNDQATLVLFGTGVEEAIRATGNTGVLTAGIDAATVSADSTRYGPALRWAQSFLSRSALPRKQVVLISDFQRSGWERQEEIRLPEGAELVTASVASAETTNLSVTSVAFQRARFSNEERVTITAGLSNRGARDVTNQPVRLDVDGRTVETRNVSIGPNASGSVTFPPVTASESVRASIQAGTDALPADNNFHFVLAPSRPVSVLVVQADGEPVSGAGSPSLFLLTAFDVATAPRFTAEVVPVSRLTAASYQGHAVVVLNDATTLGTQALEGLNRFVEQGGGLLIAAADRSPWNGDSPLMPGRLGAMVDRKASLGTLGYLDYSHPVFEPFRDPRNGTFTNIRFHRYRRLDPGSDARVLARFDDGGAAMVERRVGSGRVIVWTSTLDNGWNDFATKPLFPVVLPAALRHLAQYEEPEAWYTVGRTLDVSVPIAALVREGGAGSGAGTGGRPSGVVLTPAGEQLSLGGSGAAAIALAEQGFYSVRMQGSGDRRPLSVAVNLESAESDLSPLSPQEFANTATGRAGVTATGQSLERPELTASDIEKKQSIWWFLFLAGVVALVVESMLANRLSKRFGAGLAAPSGR